MSYHLYSTWSEMINFLIMRNFQKIQLNVYDVHAPGRF